MMFSLLILYVVVLVYFSTTERYRHYAMLVAAQGAILFAVALLRLHVTGIGEMLFVLAETLVFKAVVIPLMLLRIIRRTKINRIEAFGRSQFSSLLFSLLALGASITITWLIADRSVDPLFLGVALYSLLSGLILIVMRRRMFSHMVGFLVIENGVFLFSMAVGAHMPFLINIAILLDIVLSVLMLGMFLSRIGEGMQVVDADTLTKLKD
jgi:hydrogenase-4 component E